MKLTAQRYTKYGQEAFVLEEDPIVEEYLLDIQVNGQTLYTNVCSPWDLEELALGVLLAEGILAWDQEPQDLEVQEGRINVLLPGWDKNQARPQPPPISNRRQLTSNQVFQASQTLADQAQLFQATGGVHGAALFDQGLSSFKTDISRHNTLNRLLGQAYLEKRDLGQSYLAYSGRTPSEIIHKVWRMNIGILISPSAPSSLGIRLAQEAGLCLIGFSRDQRFSIYTHPERIKDFNR